MTKHISTFTAADNCEQNIVSSQIKDALHANDITNLETARSILLCV